MIDGIGGSAAAAAQGYAAFGGPSEVSGASAPGGGSAPAVGGGGGGNCATCTSFDRTEAASEASAYQSDLARALAQFCPASGDCAPELPPKPDSM